MDVINEIKRRYKTGSIVFRLIFINVAVFLVVGILNLFAFFGVPGLATERWLAVPADLNDLLY
ncbi:MAG: rhomboid family intramembrane serine protease, partial [Bacteroidales bacterium]|nr:rhomboid family intramembrane serine protease [Bacteroidales bacterium]